MKLVLVGIQGAGKSTQGNMLAEEIGIPYLSSGHIFRGMSKSRSKLGRWLKETLNAGILVPDETAVEIILEYLERDEYKDGFIIDGFPRTVAQSKAFTDGTEKVVFIDVSDKEALWRISGRVSDREDETLQAIRKRIGLFHEKTEPILDYYRDEGRLVRVDGENSIEQVFADIMKNIKK